MNMIITDAFSKDDFLKGKEVKNPDFIPTIGSRVFMGYTPASLVKDVIYDYEHGLIIVQCE
jgi:hypothetical protein